MEQVLSLREQLSVSETSRALLETKLQRLQQVSLLIMYFMYLHVHVCVFLMEKQ